MIKYIVIALISILFTILFRDAVSALNFRDYKDTLGALLNISSIIFAIIGAWIAIIYPRAIGRAFKQGDNYGGALDESEADAGYLSELVEIVMVSAVVLMCVLSLQFLVPLAKHLIFGVWAFRLKHAGFFVVALLVFAQLYAVFRVILANYFFLNDLRKKNVDRNVESLHR